MTVREILERNLENLRLRIAETCESLRRNPDEVRVVAVTKYIDANVARELVAAGVHDLGENRLQVAAPKLEALRELPICWHWIGTLQSNKVRKVLDSFRVIHSVDRLSLIEALETGLAERGPDAEGFKLPVYLQVNISGETSKSGAAPGETSRLVETLLASPRLECVGLMTMAPYSPDPEQARPVFAGLRDLRDRLKAQLGVNLRRLSMGMTDDFEVAIEEGATDLRIGRLLYEGLLEGPS